MSKELTEAKRQAIKRYQKKTFRQICLKLNTKTDADILDYLERQENIQGLIKDLIRNAMK